MPVNPTIAAKARRRLEKRETRLASRDHNEALAAQRRAAEAFAAATAVDRVWADPIPLSETRPWQPGEAVPLGAVVSVVTAPAVKVPPPTRKRSGQPWKAARPDPMREAWEKPRQPREAGPPVPRHRFNPGRPVDVPSHNIGSTWASLDRVGPSYRKAR